MTVAERKNVTQCGKCLKYGHWHSDHNEDRTLKPGFKSSDQPLPLDSPVPRFNHVPNGSKKQTEKKDDDEESNNRE